MLTLLTRRMVWPEHKLKTGATAPCRDSPWNVRCLACYRSSRGLRCPPGSWSHLGCSLRGGGLPGTPVCQLWGGTEGPCLAGRDPGCLGAQMLEWGAHQCHRPCVLRRAGGLERPRNRAALRNLARLPGAQGLLPSARGDRGSPAGVPGEGLHVQAWPPFSGDPPFKETSSNQKTSSPLGHQFHGEKFKKNEFSVRLEDRLQRF